MPSSRFSSPERRSNSGTPRHRRRQPSSPDTHQGRSPRTPRGGASPLGELTSEDWANSGNAVSDTGRWAAVISDLAEQATQHVALRTDFGDSMDVLDYVHVIVAPGDSRATLQQQSKYVDGIVCIKNVASGRMRSRVDAPRIMLIAGGIQYHEQPTRLANLDSLVEQEREYMALMVKRICCRYRVDVLLLGSTAAMLAREKLQEAGVSLVQNVDEGLMSRVAYFTGARVLPTVDYIFGTSDPTGTCGTWYVGNDLAQADNSGQANDLDASSESHGIGDGVSIGTGSEAGLSVMNGYNSQTQVRVGVDDWSADSCVPLMVFAGCPPHLGGTVLLRGPESLEVLQDLAWVLRVAISRRLTLIMLETMRVDLASGLSPRLQASANEFEASLIKGSANVKGPGALLELRRSSSSSNHQQRLQVLMLESESLLVTRIWLLDNIQKREPKRARIHFNGSMDQTLYQFLLSFAMLPRVLWPVDDVSYSTSASAGLKINGSSGASGTSSKATKKNTLVPWLSNDYAIVFLHGSMIVRVSASECGKSGLPFQNISGASIAASPLPTTAFAASPARSHSLASTSDGGVGVGASSALLSRAQSNPGDGAQARAATPTPPSSTSRPVADLYMWTHCPICNLSSTPTPVSPIVANISFAKLLQTLLYVDITDPLRSAICAPCITQPIDPLLNQLNTRENTVDEHEQDAASLRGHASHVQVHFHRENVVATLACEPCPSFLLCTTSLLSSWSPSSVTAGARGNCLRIATASSAHTKVLRSMYASVDDCDAAVNGLLDTIVARLQLLNHSLVEDAVFSTPVLLAGVPAMEVIEAKRVEMNTDISLIRDQVRAGLEDCGGRPSAMTVRTLSGTHVRLIALFSELWGHVRRWDVHFQDQMIRQRMRARLLVNVPNTEPSKSNDGGDVDVAGGGETTVGVSGEGSSEGE
jgi:hypothetical protein